ncbi:polyribonucleotide nucleotidyltransferase [Candidatus Liberibacter americanus]|uniref:Polyribonucleotide nucleotidyltransferase n=1 Tax=Candidatus Liberibacter americanus str. Sao Paulo TaxID=1261131 RepID=U6B3N1_9HYPH|nr:polyribonucleotide nucleotidyltransferase [Candidatus Liberibacter americanus]AHA27550.1 Polyribonucleotide nucleotidyltransferase [Candidatus Liberibacter americanus str. Sao Paulo]EMS36489.1 polynucleotide phosphorylase [Candidatus Liberibacter americanus PW_SP]
MFDVHTVEIDWAGRPLKLESGKIARQADGAVLATYGETVVLASVVCSRSIKESQDFFPLTVNYQERTYAVGKIPGGYLKRESRPTENEILISRLIDRSIRPLFHKDYKNETQVIVNVMQYDLENDPQIVGMIAVSAALMLAGLPFKGPVVGAQVDYVNNKYVLNPRFDEDEKGSLDLFVSGTRDAVLMVELEADQLSEDLVIDAIMFGHSESQSVIDAISRLVKLCGKDPLSVEYKDLSELKEKAMGLIESDLRKACYVVDKSNRRDLIDEINNKVISQFEEEDPDCDKEDIRSILDDIKYDIVRKDILANKCRMDGRDLTTVREISAEVGILQRTHGSALFSRGATQAIVVTTLGTKEDEQFIDSLSGTKKNDFMMHYNFFPFSVGEVGRISSLSRREIGHGMLAKRAIRPVLPKTEIFPYTLRMVSEITESNGSSSMATVCGSSLSLMDAGVPILKPVAGIAMGLIKEDDRFVILSDISGDEDHLGDMDFKIAGTDSGITAMQMDMKIEGISKDIMVIALQQAKEGRLHILAEMSKVMSESRLKLGEFAPRIEVMMIAVDKIRDVIGTGGKVIRDIVDKTGAKISIEDDGTIKIASTSTEGIEAARKRIRQIVDVPEVNKIYKGKVVKTTDFGAFVNFFGARDGLVHISQLSSERVAKTSDVVKQGDTVWVKLLDFDDRGKIKLSMKAVDQKTGKLIS